MSIYFVSYTWLLLTMGGVTANDIDDLDARLACLEDIVEEIAEGMVVVKNETDVVPQMMTDITALQNHCTELSGSQTESYSAINHRLDEQEGRIAAAMSVISQLLELHNITNDTSGIDQESLHNVTSSELQGSLAACRETVVQQNHLINQLREEIQRLQDRVNQSSEEYPRGQI